MDQLTQQAMSDLRKKLRDEAAKVNALSAEKAQLEQELTSTRRDLQSTRQQLEVEQKTLTATEVTSGNLKQWIEDLRKSLNEYKVDMKEAQSRFNAANTEIEGLKVERDNLRKQLQMSRREADSERKAKDELSARIDRAERAAKQAEERLKASAKDLAHEQAKVSSLQSTVAQSDRDKKAVEAQLTGLTATLTDTDSGSSDIEKVLRGQLRKAHESTQAVEQARMALEGNFTRLENEKNQLQTEFDTLRSANRELETQVDDIIREKDAETGHLDDLQFRYEALDRNSKEDQKALTHLRSGVKVHLLNESGQSVKNLPAITKPIEELQATFIDAMVRGVLDRVSTMTATSADIDTRYTDTLATMLPATTAPKTVSVFLQIVSQGHHRDDLEDLWALNEHFFSHPAKGSEPVWVWLTISHFLNIHLKNAFGKRNGVRYSVLLHFAAQLDQILASLRKPTYISGLTTVDIDQQILELGSESYIGFVTAVRYYGAIDSLNTLTEHPSYQKDTEVSSWSKPLAEWAKDVKKDGSLYEALTALDMEPLRVGMSTYLHHRIDRSSGYTLSVFWDTLAGSPFRNETIMFVEHHDTAKTVEFSPEFSIDLDERWHYRLILKPNTSGVDVNRKSQLFEWLNTLYKDECSRLLDRREEERRQPQAAEGGFDEEL